MRSRLVRFGPASILFGVGVLLVVAAGLPDYCNEWDPALIAGGSIATSGGFALGLAWWTQRRSLHAMLGGGQEFPGMDLNECDLSGFSLPGKNFRGAYFIRANLRGAKLHGANLTHAWLTDADLRGTRFDAIELSPSNTLFPSNTLAPGPIQPEADMNGVHLSRAKYDDDTRWPNSIDPEAAGAIKVKRPWWRRVFGSGE